MKRFFIEEAKCDFKNFGMIGYVDATIRFKTDGDPKWITLSEVDGIPCYFLTDNDVFDDLLANDTENEAFWDFLNSHSIQEFNGIEFGENYRDTYISIFDDPENPANPLIKLLILLVRCPADEIDGIISMSVGKYVDELSIPISDIEEEMANGYEDAEA